MLKPLFLEEETKDDMDNSTLNIINIELKILRTKQENQELSVDDIKKLDILVNLKKTVSCNPEIKDPHDEFDNKLFTEDDIDEFLKKRTEKSGKLPNAVRNNIRTKELYHEKKAKKAQEKKTAKEKSQT